MGNPLVRLGAMTVAGFVYGLATSYIPMPGHGVVSEFWLGNLCAPWLVLAFVAGRLQIARAWAVAAGSLVDLACVFGFYFRTFDLHARWGDDPSAPAPSVLAEVGRFLHVREQWFAVALVSGALYGGLGWMWRRRRWLPAGLAVAAGFVAEPALWPLYNGFYKGPWFVWAIEVLVGVAVAGWFTVAARQAVLVAAIRNPDRGMPA
jgi:hypothetical protein